MDKPFIFGSGIFYHTVYSVSNKSVQVYCSQSVYLNFILLPITSALSTVLYHGVLQLNDIGFVVNANVICWVKCALNIYFFHFLHSTVRISP